MRVIAVAAVLYLLTVSASWGGGAHAPASHAQTHWRGTVVAPHHERVALSSISCASPGNCTAVGWYRARGAGQQGLLLTEKAGRWGNGARALLPANAASNPHVNLNSVSCASAGNCTAVGTYIDGSEGGLYTESGGTAGLLLTEKHGRWARGVEAVLPADAASDPVSISNRSRAFRRGTAALWAATPPTRGTSTTSSYLRACY